MSDLTGETSSPEPALNFCDCGLARYVTEDGETFACPECDGYEPDIPTESDTP